MAVQNAWNCAKAWCFHWLPSFGQFISSTLPTFAVCEKFVVMEINNEEKLDGGNNNWRVAVLLCGKPLMIKENQL